LFSGLEDPKNLFCSNGVMGMKTVSVVTPCYNDGIYIRDAINSVRAQTYPDIEIIIIDDGSDDEITVREIRTLAEETGITVIRTDHVGPSGARNAGIIIANGEYILPLDADDIIEPTYIEKAAAVLDEDENIGVVYCHADVFGKWSGDWGLPEYSLYEMLADNVVFVTSLFRKADWETVGGFRTSMKHGMEDYDFWLSLLEIGREIVQLPETLFHYRIKSTSRTTKFVQDEITVKETYRAIYHQHPVLYEQYRDMYAMALRDVLVNRICRIQAMEKEMDELRGQLAEVQTAYDVLVNRICRIQAMEKEKNELRSQLAEVQSAYEDISTAFFWKLTKPLRVLADTLKRFLKRVRRKMGR